MSLTYNFSGKVALVTGSSSGIGAATAVLFAKSGANVVVTGRNATKVSEVAKQCLNVSPKGLKALEVVADVTKDEDLIRLVDTTVQTFGKIDILVNNAGMAVRVGFEDKDYMNGYKQQLQTNLDSVVFLTHICVKHLEINKGNIINISSNRSVQTVIIIVFENILKYKLIF
jgi:NAD(P)-dependent dehydrogenase (short-subunit alcohol dehydrogenase family)